MIIMYFANVLDIVMSTYFSDLEKNIYPLCELILQIKLVRALYGGSSFGSNVGHCTFIKGGLVVHCTVSYISSVSSNWIWMHEGLRSFSSCVLRFGREVEWKQWLAISSVTQKYLQDIEAAWASFSCFLICLLIIWLSENSHSSKTSVRSRVWFLELIYASDNGD